MAGQRWDADILLAADADLQAHIADGAAHGGGGGGFVPHTLHTDYLVLITGPNAATIYNYAGTQFGTTSSDVAGLWASMQAAIAAKSPTGANVVVRAVAATPFTVNLKSTLEFWNGGVVLGPGIGKVGQSSHPDAGYLFGADASFTNNPALPAQERTLFDISGDTAGLENIWVSGFSADVLGRLENAFMVRGKATTNQIFIDHLHARGFRSHGFSFGVVDSTSASAGVMGHDLQSGQSAGVKFADISAISMAASGVCTVTTAAAHGMVVGQVVSIWDVKEDGRPGPGAAPAGGGYFNVFNGWYKVATVADSTHFTYQVGDGTLGAHTAHASTGAVYSDRASLGAYQGDLQLEGPGQLDVPGGQMVGLLISTDGNLVHVGPGFHIGGGGSAQTRPQVVIKGGNDVRLLGHYVDNIYGTIYGGIYVVSEKGAASILGILIDDVHYNINYDASGGNLLVPPWVTVDKTKGGTLVGIDVLNPQGNGSVAGGGSPAFLRLVDVPASARVRARGGHLGPTLAPYELLGTAVAPDIKDVWFRKSSSTGLDGRSEIRGTHVFAGAGTFTVNPSDPLYANPTNIQLTVIGTAYRNARAENIGGVATGSFDITVDGACTIAYVALVE